MAAAPACRLLLNLAPYQMRLYDRNARAELEPFLQQPWRPQDPNLSANAIPQPEFRLSPKQNAESLRRDADMRQHSRPLQLRVKQHHRHHIWWLGNSLAVRRWYARHKVWVMVSLKPVQLLPNCLFGTWRCQTSSAHALRAFTYAVGMLDDDTRPNKGPGKSCIPRADQQASHICLVRMCREGMRRRGSCILAGSSDSASWRYSRVPFGS